MVNIFGLMNGSKVVVVLAFSLKFRGYTRLLGCTSYKSSISVQAFQLH